MANKPKKLTASNILSLHSKVFTQKAIYCDVEGEIFEVLIDKKFQTTKIQELIMEMIEKQQQIATFEDIFKMEFYKYFLIIKYFTNISVANVNNFEKQIRIYSALLNLGVFETVLESFEQGEIDKIDKYIKKVSDRIGEINSNPEAMAEITEMVQSISDIQNPKAFMSDEEIEKAEQIEEITEA